MEVTSLYNLHEKLIRDTFGCHLTDSDAFLVFVLFHSYKVLLSGPHLTDRPDILAIAADTQRSVSETLASVHADTSDGRADMSYWYRRWNLDWGSYGHADHLTHAEQKRIDELKVAIERHPFVSRLLLDD